MQDLKQRTFLFAVSVGKLIVDLPFTVVNKAYSNQLSLYGAHLLLVQIIVQQEEQSQMPTLFTSLKLLKKKQTKQFIFLNY